MEIQEQIPYSRIWEREKDDPGRKSALIINEDSSRVSYLFPIPYSHTEREYSQLFHTLFKKGWKHNFKDIEVVVVGHIPKEIEAFSAKAPMGAIRWWPMEPEDSLESVFNMQSIVLHVRKK